MLLMRVSVLGTYVWLNCDVDGTDGPRGAQVVPVRDSIIHVIALSLPETERSLEGPGADAVLTNDGIPGDDPVGEHMVDKVCELRFEVVDKAAEKLPRKLTYFSILW